MTLSNWRAIWAFSSRSSPSTRSSEATWTPSRPPLRTGRADVTEENIQARIRGNILMALSNKFGALVLSTGNKSEIAVGYCTLYGDMAGGLAVIADVPKTMVYELARYLNRDGERIPAACLDKAPFGGTPSQSDRSGHAAALRSSGRCP